MLGRRYEAIRMLIDTDATGNGSKSFLFEAEFVGPPVVLLNKSRSDSGIYLTTNLTSAGGTVSITSSDIVSSTVQVLVFAWEQL